MKENRFLGPKTNKIETIKQKKFSIWEQRQDTSELQSPSKAQRKNGEFAPLPLSLQFSLPLPSSPLILPLMVMADIKKIEKSCKYVLCEFCWTWDIDKEMNTYVNPSICAI